MENVLNAFVMVFQMHNVKQVIYYTIVNVQTFSMNSMIGVFKISMQTSVATKLFKTQKLDHLDIQIMPAKNGISLHQTLIKAQKYIDFK